MAESRERVVVSGVGIAMGVLLVACGSFLIGLSVGHDGLQTAADVRRLHAIRVSGTSVVAGGIVAVISAWKGLGSRRPRTDGSDQ